VSAAALVVVAHLQQQPDHLDADQQQFEPQRLVAGFHPQQHPDLGRRGPDRGPAGEPLLDQHGHPRHVDDDAQRLRLDVALVLFGQLMRRVACEERANWRDIAHELGFDFHTANDVPYWVESAYYAFTLEQIERDIEAPTGELEAMSRELVARAIDDERIMAALQIPRPFWNWIARSFKSDELSLYGRFDLRYDGNGPAKLLEFNADTPTGAYETGVFQWRWLEDAIARKVLPAGADQYNSLHERLIEGWKVIGRGRRVHFGGVRETAEDAGTLAYIEDCARQAGLDTKRIEMADIGRAGRSGFVDLDNEPIELMFKLYPWEWMMREAFGAALPGAPTQFVEPPWRAILSNKAILPLLWAAFPNHPNLLPAYFESDPRAAELGTSYARKPLFSREGANVELISDGRPVDRDEGPYGTEGFIRQALAPLPVFDGNHTVIGSWFAAGQPCGLMVREDASPITKNSSRFLPHAIVG
jgi:glutathionylspermidine synthase